jgi:hypothetical protein
VSDERAVEIDWSVRDLARVRGAVARFGKEARAEIKAANLDAAELVVELAKARARRHGGVARHVADSGMLRAKATQRKAEVILGPGGRRGPAIGAEFGALRVKQFGPWTGNDERAGTFLFPTLRDDRKDIVEVWSQLMLDLAARTVRDAAA